MVEPRRSEKACGSGVSRRDFLRAGGLGLASCGVGFPAIPTRASTRSESERSVILLLLVGGPSQLETFDPKPDAPAGIRGPFDSIATRVPGIRVSEHLPRLAARMDRVALLRSVHHDAAPIHETGHQLLQTGRLGQSGEEFPHFGSVVARIGGSGRQRPASVILPGPITSTGVDIPHGQSAGCLGPGFEPDFLTLDRAVTGLADEPDRVRDAYGPTTSVGVASWRGAWSSPACGWSRSTCSRRSSAGSPGTATAARRSARSTTTPGRSCRRSTGPSPRCWTTSSGRDGSIRRWSSRRANSAGRRGSTPSGGRDHWPGVWTVAMAGGGIRGGQVVGASDAPRRRARRPARHPPGPPGDDLLQPWHRPPNAR